MAYRFELTPAESTAVRAALKSIQDITKEPDLLKEVHKLYRADERPRSGFTPSTKEERDCRAIRWFLNGVRGISAGRLYEAQPGNRLAALAGAFYGETGRVPADDVEILARASAAYDEAHKRACATN